jgi:hypothetical protein
VKSLLLTTSDVSDEAIAIFSEPWQYNPDVTTRLLAARILAQGAKRAHLSVLLAASTDQEQGVRDVADAGIDSLAHSLSTPELIELADRPYPRAANAAVGELSRRNDSTAADALARHRLNGGRGTN